MEYVIESTGLFVEAEKAGRCVGRNHKVHAYFFKLKRYSFPGNDLSPSSS